MDGDYRSWAEMRAEGIEIETMQEYQDEVRGLHDYPPEPLDAHDDYYFGAPDLLEEDYDEEPYELIEDEW